MAEQVLIQFRADKELKQEVAEIAGASVCRDYAGEKYHKDGSKERVL